VPETGIDQELNREGRRHGAPSPLEPIAVGPRQAAALLGVSIPTIYKLLNSGDLPSVSAGTRRLIAVSALRAFMEVA
jgi:excisionase family DNA binding protein